MRTILAQVPMWAWWTIGLVAVFAGVLWRQFRASKKPPVANIHISR